MDDNQPAVLENHAVLLQHNQIVNIFPQSEVAQHSTATPLTLDNHVLMPGLINLHGHSAMTLLRGLADDLALMDWLNNHIWPAEGKHVSEAFVYHGSRLAMAEMIRGGTTTINDMYFYHSGVARAAIEAGMRAFVGCSILEFPTNYADNATAYIEKGLAEKAQFEGEALVTFTLAPHAPYTVSDATFTEVARIAEREDLLIHCHIHETAGEVNDSVTEHGVRPLARLDKLGVLSERLIAAHMVHLNEAEIALSAKRGLSIAHNPASNMKLASGFAPIQKLLDAGVTVGLGTDGAASNNKLDMLADTRLAALIAKGNTQSPTDVKAHDALKMATINGAKALHIDDKVGSLTAGKQADMIAIDLSAVETQPVFDPVSHIAYAAGREQVSHVWINGQLVLDNQQLTTLSLTDIQSETQVWRSKIIA